MSHLLIYSDRNYVIWHFLCLHLNIQSTVSQVPTVLILFAVVSVFRVEDSENRYGVYLGFCLISTLHQVFV